MDEMRLILLGVGVMVIALIYLWGMRARIRSRLDDRRRRAAARSPENEPVLEASEATDAPAGEIEKTVVPRDPFAHQRLVDVEIGPVKRILPEPAETVDLEPGITAGARPGSKAEVRPLPRAAVTPFAKTDTRPLGKGEFKLAPKAEVMPLPKAGVTPLSKADARASHRPRQDSAVKDPGAAAPEMMVLMTVLAPAGQPFKGRRIWALARQLDLRLGQTGVFECVAALEGQDTPIFSVGHLREPGTFDEATIDAMETHGLLLFMRLPGPLPGVPALERFVAMAGQLAEKLGGTVCDDRRNKMTNQALVHLRGEVIELERRRRVWAHQQRG